MSVQDIDHGFKAVIEAYAKANVDVVIGVMGDAGEDLVTIAAVQEFGSADGHIPQRSFLRATMDEHRGEIFDALEKQLKITDPKTAAQRVGLMTVGLVQEKIRNRIAPADSPLTIKRKGSDVPLIDSGRLIQSIRSQVR